MTRGRNGAVPGSTRDTARSKSRPGLIARGRYRFDLALSRGPLVVVGYLGLITLAIIVLAALVLSVLRIAGINGGGRLDFAQATWQSLVRVLDTGTFASDRDWPARFVALFVTLAGIFIAGSLIGLIANAVDQQIEKLRKGRSAVLESGHTLVLGWSPRLASILSEIVIANSNHRKQAFVVLADRAKQEMEDELHRLVPDTQTTRVVCRTGDVGNVDDLLRVNVEGARSVIVLAGEQGDAGVVKAVLAVRSLDPDFARVRLVAELDDAGHARTLRALTDDKIVTVRADDVVSQVAAQACHQSGLAAVFRDLLDFAGDEIYFASVPELTGHTYLEALQAFEECSVIGLLRAGQVILNPSGDQVFAADDEVIAIAADDDRVLFTGFAPDGAAAPAAGESPDVQTQRIALIGWSPLGVAVLVELDHFLCDGSVVDVLVDRTLLTRDDIELPKSVHCTVEVHLVEPGLQPLLAVLAGRCYQQAIVLGYRSRIRADQADARSMLTLLALQRAFAGMPDPPRVVAEMRDRANVAVAQTTGVDDFIVSDELSSLMIAQLSERLELQRVFQQLFAVDGCSLSLHPAVRYAPGRPTSYSAIVAAAAARGVTALGYRIGEAPVVLNPPKSTELDLGQRDQVLVISPRVAAPAASVPIGQR